ncbi:unnamed protein product, partial [Oppiella nova]
IGVVNRSQKDIDDRKDIRKALSDESKFFTEHPAYGPDMAHKLGIKYLQEYLQSELSNHIFRRLPQSKPKLETKLFEINERLSEMDVPLTEETKERHLAQTNESFRQSFDSAMGGKVCRVDTKKLSGGARINVLMNDTFAKEVDQLFYDETRLGREIATAILNAPGARLALFIPDVAFTSCVESQIELFRMPSLACVDWVTNEIINSVNESIDKLKCFPNLKNIYSKLTLDSVRESNKKCKIFVEHIVATEKCYINTIHEDFKKVTGELTSSLISDVQLKVTTQAIQQNSKSDRFSYKKKDFWFVLKGSTLSWFTDETHKVQRGSVDVKGFHLKSETDFSLTLVLSKKKLLSLGSNSEHEFVFNSKDMTLKWKDWFEGVGVKVDNGGPAADNESLYKDTKSESNQSLSRYSQSSHSISSHSCEDMAFPDHMPGQVDVVKKYIDKYVVILKTIFRDRLPKLCQLELIDSTSKFIATELHVRLRHQFPTIDDILGEDPDKDERIDLQNRKQHYIEAIDIIDKFSKMKL